jgi:death-on-curing family protein
VSRITFSISRWLRWTLTVDHLLQYGDVNDEYLDDIFVIAAMYAVALARGHVFNDANKRTALVTALTYLSIQGIDLPRSDELEDMMVDVASGDLELMDFSELLYSLAAREFTK